MPCLRALLASVVVVGTLAAQRFVQLPDDHFLSKSSTQNQANGSTLFWGPATATGRRFQVLYDASHFTGVHGIAGPIAIRHVRFRGEDSEHNRGGQTFTGVTARLYATTLAAAAPLSTTFANNLPPVAPATLLATLTLPSLAVGASLGRSPNNDVLDLDFSAVAMLPFDPTSAQPNLLLDVSYVAASAANDPQATAMVPIQDTAGTAAAVRGRALLTTVSASATSGAASVALPTMRIEFSGGGGFAALQPARTERIGAACGGTCASFYELFASHQPFDLMAPGQIDGLSGLVLTPNQYPAPSYYTVSGGAAPVDLGNGLSPVPATTGDDVTVPFALPPGIAFDYPGAPPGGTTAIRAATNGYVLVDPAATETVADFSPTVAELLGAGAGDLARFCPFWHDFVAGKNATPPFGDPLAGLHITYRPATTEVLVTWYRVGRFNSVNQVFQESHTFQLSLRCATGVVQFRYGAMDEIWADSNGGQISGIVGFARGRIGGTTPSLDPQSRDLSIERPFATQVEGGRGHLGLTAVSSPVAAGAVYQARAFGGQQLSWNVSGIPPGALLGALLLDVAATRPGLQQPGLLAAGCRLSTSLGALVRELAVLPGPTVVGTTTLAVPIGYAPSLVGIDLYAQYVLLDGLSGSGDLIPAASNALRHSLGNQ